MREELLKQAARGEADAKVARAVRRREQARQDTVAHDKLMAESAAQERAAKSEALQRATRELDKRREELLARERRLAAAAARERAAKESERRKKDLEAAGRGWDANDFGQGKKKGGGERHLKARQEALKRVSALGNPLRPEHAANWKVWARRYDEQGCARYGSAWGSVFRDEMKAVLDEFSKGDLNAFRFYHRQKSRRWALEGGELAIPSALPRDAAPAP